MKPLYKGMLATFFGVLFGSLVALAVQQVWMLGAILGGIASAGVSAYILFDAKAVLVAVPKAWKRAVNWRPDEETVNVCKSIFLTVCLGLITAVAWSLATVWYTDQIAGIDFSLFFILSFLVTILVCIGHANSKSAFLVQENGNAIWRDVAKLFFWQSPLLVLGVVWQMPRAFRWTFKTALPAIGRFAKELFILIHCRDRAMCLVDSSLGMVVAFFAQQQFLGGGPLLSVSSILVGGIAGTVLFFFNREVVAIRWLKVQPNGVHA